MENVAESFEKKRAKRTKYPKHACVTRTYKFAMDVPATKSTAFFDACGRLCAVRNRLVEHLSEQRRANRQLTADGGTPTWSSKGDLFKLVSGWAKADEALGKLHSHLLQNVVDRVLEGTQRWLEALREGRPGVRPPGHRRVFDKAQASVFLCRGNTAGGEPTAEGETWREWAAGNSRTLPP